MRMFLSVLAMLALAACATAGKYEAVLNSWLGSTEAELVSAWGPPMRVYDAPGGTRVLTYSNSGNIVMPGTPARYQSTVIGNTVYTQQVGGTSGYNIALSCTTNITVTNGRITHWSWQGNNCVSR